MSIEQKHLYLDKPLTLVLWELSSNLKQSLTFFSQTTEIIEIQNFSDFLEWQKRGEVKNLILGLQTIERIHEETKKLSSLSVEKRRSLFVILISPCVKTLNPIENFIYGTNLLINQNDISDIEKIFSIAKSYWEDLYRPYYRAFNKLLEEPL